MNENKDVAGTYFIIFLRVLIIVGIAITIISIIYFVAQGIPIGEFFTGGDIMLVLGSFLLMYCCFELHHHKELKKKNAAMRDGNTDVSDAEIQQAQTIFDSPDKIRFWFGVCCGVVSSAVLLWLLFDRVLFSVIFS